MQRIELLDTTLRDGAQGEGVEHSLSDKRKIALALDFEYRGRVLAPVFRAGFEKLADRMVDEFCREAGREHG